MTSTPSVTAPYPVDTVLNIPSDAAFVTTGTASFEDDLLGVQDWTIPYDVPVSVPVDVPLDVPLDVPIAPSITAPLPNALIDKIGVPRFNDTLKKINDMDTTKGIPPKITFDLHGMFSAMTSRFGNPTNPFHVEPLYIV